ncbi:DUF6493 family protein [Pseudoduganella violaceinigra]|uniref:DUF6493 family protein n=1 Tax=Pseudoduganella violaceinigra TaxID=246602 RepID=UPI00040823D3|nr:DUF6493 family protein [Pseudoduganella violaceinigra]
MSFKPLSELESLIYAGDGNAALDLLERMPQTERIGLAERLQCVADMMHYWWYDPEKVHECWGMRATDGQRDAIAVAMLVCAPADSAARFRVPADRMLEVVLRFQPPNLPQLAVESLRYANPAAALKLSQTGLSPLQFDDEAVMRLMGMSRFHSRRDGLRSYLVANIDVLKPYLLMLFEVEGSSEVNLAAMDKYNVKGEMTWAANLLQLCDDGVYSRQELLARCLGTLERDWPQFRSSWFSRFHDQLAPTVEEMAAESGRYLLLLHSRIPPTVTMALKACAKLFDKKLVDAGLLMEALRPVMLSSVKAQVSSALKLLETMVKRDPACGHAAARLALEGLQHTDPELQQAIIARLEKWGMDEDGRSAAQGMLSFVAPSVQPSLAALFDDSPGARQDAWRDIELPAAAAPMSPLDPSRALDSPAGQDELVALCAQLLEDDSNLDRLEAAIGALLQAAPLDADAKARFAPVLKRARKLKPQREYKGCVSREFARLLLAVAGGERVDSPWTQKAVTGELAARIDELSAPGAPLLDIATHRGGYIDPTMLVERAATLGAEIGSVPLAMQVRALLRLAPCPDSSALDAAQRLPDTPFKQALCYALGGDWPADPVAALVLAAARIRHPHEDDPRALLAFSGEMPDGAVAGQARLVHEFVKSSYGDYWRPRGHASPAPGGYGREYLAAYRYQDFWAEGEALIMYGASLFPSSLEAMLTAALPQMASEVQWHEACWHHTAYLRLLGDPTAQWTPAATLALGLGLMGKEPGQTAMAIDAFVAASQDGRLAPAAMAHALLSVSNSFFMAARLARSLQSASGAGHAMPDVVLSLLGALCELPDDEPPRDFAKLLQLMLDLRLQYRLRPAAAALAALARLKLGGKAPSIRNAIVASAGRP